LSVVEGGIEWLDDAGDALSSEEIDQQRMWLEMKIQSRGILEK
jgi:hypothetical protein